MDESELSASKELIKTEMDIKEEKISYFENTICQNEDLVHIHCASISKLISIQKPVFSCGPNEAPPMKIGPSDIKVECVVEKTMGGETIQRWHSEALSSKETSDDNSDGFLLLSEDENEDDDLSDLSESNILATLDGQINGNISEIEGFIDTDDENDYTPPNESKSESETTYSEEAETRHTTVAYQGQFRRHFWLHKEDFNPIPPAPKFEKNWIGKEVDPFVYFQNYIGHDVFERFAKYSNRNFLERTGKPLSTNANEIKLFFGITMRMSTLRYPRIKMFWANLTRISQVAEKMSKNRYFALRNNLKLVYDNEVTNEEKATKFWKVIPLVNSVREGCLRNPRSTNVSIDEQMIPFWGHTNMRQYVRGKPNPCGIKNFVATTSEGLPLDFFLYEGKGDTIWESEESEDLHIGARVVMRLTENIPEGCCIYMDRYFTSVELLERLHRERLCSGTGVIQLGRIPYNAQLKSDSDMQKAGRGSIDQVVRNDGQVCIVKWFDNKAVHVASSSTGTIPIDECKRWNKSQNKYISLQRPNAIKNYSNFMGGVDFLDRMINYYQISARTKKWTVRVIFYLFDFAAAASWIEYRKDMKSIGKGQKEIDDYLKFRMHLSEALCNRVGESESSVDCEAEPVLNSFSNKRKITVPHPSHAARKKGALHMPEIEEAKKNHRCRLPGCKSVHARIKCSKCKIHLCLVSGRNCFKRYHEARKLK